MGFALCSSTRGAIIHRNLHFGHNPAASFSHHVDMNPLVEMSAADAGAAQTAAASHDGIAAKRAQVLLACARGAEVAAVIEVTNCPEPYIRQVIAGYAEAGADYFSPRPEPRLPAIENTLFSTYEGPEWGYYKGALSHGPVALNHLVSEKIVELFPNKADTSILEIGTGEGALHMMLRDKGYRSEAVDVGDFEMVPTDVDVTIMNADQGLVHALPGRQFDVVVAVEVIEHLRHPWKFFEELGALLKPGGYAIVTTPNITGFVSRARFLVFGEFYLFPKPKMDIDYHGHIMPLHWHTVDLMLRTSGFTDVKVSSVLPQSAVLTSSLKALAFSVVRVLAKLLARKGPTGRHLFVVARRG